MTTWMGTTVTTKSLVIAAIVERTAMHFVS